MNIQFLIIGIAAAVVWLVGSCVLIHFIRTRPKKAGLYAATIVLFIICTGVFIGVQIGVVIAKETIMEYTAMTDDYIIKNYGNLPFVRAGVDISAAPQALSELENMIPYIITTELQLSNPIINSFVKSGTDMIFAKFRSRTSVIFNYANESGRITSSSIIQAFETELIARVLRIAFWIYIALAVVLVIFLCIRFSQFLEKPRQ